MEIWVQGSISDVNVSVRKSGDKELGTRAELKKYKFLSLLKKQLIMRLIDK